MGTDSGKGAKRALNVNYILFFITSGNEGLSFCCGEDFFSVFSDGVDSDGDFLFSEAEHGIEGSGGFDFIGGVAARVTDDGEHGSDNFSFKVFGVYG